MPPVAGLVLDLGMNGVATGGGTYPDDTYKRREVQLEEGATLPASISLSALPCLPTLLSLTRALKGSFLVMSSSSEDRESISKSILLTFSLGYRFRDQGTHPGTPSPPHPIRPERQGEVREKDPPLSLEGVPM